MAKIKTKIKNKKAKIIKPKPAKASLAKAPEEMHKTKIRVIGIGGGGGSIAAEIASDVKRVDFWAANTDIQALKRIGKTCHQFIFGQNITRGLGCGSNPRLGQLSVKSSEEKVARLFEGVDFCILISCLGGGTGSGSVAEFAKTARKAGCLTLGIFTLPFRFEGDKKMHIAKQALARTIPHLSASVVFPNEKIFQVIDKETGFKTALSAVNAILARDLKNLIETIYLPGLINIDFADLRAVLEGEGKFAYLASASARNENKAEEACKNLLAHPLNEYDPTGAERILFNITSDKNLSVEEVDYVSRSVSALNPHAKIIFGISYSRVPQNTLVVTLLATGRQAPPKKEKGGLKKIKKWMARKDNKSAGHQKSVAIQNEPRKKTGSESKSKERGDNKIKPKIKSKKAKIKTKPKAQSPRSIGVKNDGKSPLKSGVKLSEIRPRKNALDLKREMEKAEQEQLDQETKWDIPAFLRRKI